MSYNDVTSCSRDAGILFQLFHTILSLFDSQVFCIQVRPSDSSENQMEAEVILAFLSERNVTRDLLTSHNNPFFYPAHGCCLPLETKARCQKSHTPNKSPTPSFYPVWSSSDALLTLHMILRSLSSNCSNRRHTYQCLFKERKEVVLGSWETSFPFTKNFEVSFFSSLLISLTP